MKFIVQSILALTTFWAQQEQEHGSDDLSVDLPLQNTTHPWLDTWRTPHERAALLLANMTLDEKLMMIEGAAALDNHGVGAAVNPCIGLVKPAERLGIPHLCMGDGPSGVSNGLGNVTTFPAPIVVSSSFRPSLMYEYAKATAQEHRAKGHNVALSPTINIQRTPLWGRNAESLSEDPYLTSQMAIASVKGIQSENILACPKHFAAYNQETNRFGDAPEWGAANVIVSNRTLQELYFPAFKAVVEEANPGSVMTAYNKVNGLHASENDVILGDLFSWGFEDGFTVTDWYFGHRSTLEAALAGQTVSMPGGPSDFGFEDYYGKDVITPFIDNGSLPTTVFDDMIRRVITPMFIHGLVEDDQLGEVNDDVRTEEHRQLSLKTVHEGSVLLKNDGLLPLMDSIKKIAVIGSGGDYGALVSERYGGFVGSPNLNETLITPLAGIRARVPDAKVTFSQGTPALASFEQIPISYLTVNKSSTTNGILTTAWNNGQWSGSPKVTDVMTNLTSSCRWSEFNNTWPNAVSSKHEAILTPTENGTHSFSIYGGGFVKLFVDETLVTFLRKNDFANIAFGDVDLMAGHPVSLRVEYSTAPAITAVGFDLGWLPPSASSKLVDEAVEAAKNAEVAVVFVGNILSEGGDGSSLALSTVQNTLVSSVSAANPNTVVIGQTNNPFLMPWLDSVPAVMVQWYAGEAVGTALADLLFGDVNPSGKLPMTFPPADLVGPGNSLRTFPGVQGDSIGDHFDVYYDEELLVGYKWFDAHQIEPLFPFGFGLSYTTFDLAKPRVSQSTGSISLTSSVTNTGDAAGSEVVQLYVGYPSAAAEPPKLLRRFEKVDLAIGEAKEVSFELDADKDLHYWSEEKGGWTVASGEYKLYLGTSAGDIEWTSSVYLK